MADELRTDATILIVDEQEANVRLLEGILEHAGYTNVRGVLDPRETLRMYAEFAPDLILLDLLMPQLDGFAVLDQLRSAIPADSYLPILVLTADISAEAKQRALASGAKDFLTKPLDVVEVLLRIGNLLQTRMLHRQLQNQNQILEAQVRERTAALTRANAQLHVEIASRQRAQAALSASEQRFRALIEKSADAIAVIGSDGIVLYASPACSRILGYPVEALVGCNVLQLLHPDDAPDATKRLAQILETPGGIVQSEARARHQDATWRWLEGGITNLLHDPSVRGLVANFRDVTERKRLEEQFRQVQKMEIIGQLAGGIAHDFNNMLSAVIGLIGSAQEQLPPDSPVQPSLEIAEGAAWRAARLTRQLLTFARKQAVEPRVLNLNTVILDLARMLRRLIGDDIELVMQVAPTLGQVKVDPGQIEQVIINLAVNARDAMPDTGRLTIETAEVVLDSGYTEQHVSVTPGAYVMLSISDTGSGMDAEVQQHLFEPFFTTKEPGKGTGLGLATCYGIIKQHGGHIWVSSEVGRGTTFKIYLPRVEEPAAPLLPPPVSLAGGGAPRALR